MSKPPATRRFIAGAVCPRCSAMDTIVVDQETDLRECVTCGFSEARPKDSVGVEARTRVNRPLRRSETPSEAVRLVDPSRQQSED